jgi:hypothetical protein
MGKEWEAECLLALYSFICNDGFIEITKIGSHHYFEVIPIAAACLATLKEITETSLMPSALEKKSYLDHFGTPLIEEIRGKG